MNEELHTLTLSELRERLKERGVEIGLSTLSEMIKDGDIAEQLDAQRKGNKLLFPPDAVTVLAAFLSHFRETPNLKNAARPDALRAFLKKQDGQELTAMPNVPVPSTHLSDIRENANIGLEIVRAMQQVGVIPPIEDRLLTLKEAATEYGVSMAVLHKMSVLEGGRRKVKRSVVLTYIASL